MSRRQPAWLDAHAVIAIHRMLVAEFGGSSGMRSAALLESALARPKHRNAYGRPDLAALAAAYAAGIIRNHPFVDGNKRAGFMAAYVFLDRNGAELVAPEVEATAMTLALAAGDVDERAFAVWLRRHLQARRRSAD